MQIKGKYLNLFFLYLSLAIYVHIQFAFVTAAARYFRDWFFRLSFLQLKNFKNVIGRHIYLSGFIFHTFLFLALRLSSNTNLSSSSSEVKPVGDCFCFLVGAWKYFKRLLVVTNWNLKNFDELLYLLAGLIFFNFGIQIRVRKTSGLLCFLLLCLKCIREFVDWWWQI